MSGSDDPNNKGGSIYVKDTGSTLHATSCVFFLNTVSSSGGGVNNEKGSVQLYHSNITGNTAASGGGVRTLQGSVVLQDSIIADNSASYAGGGIDQNRGTFTMTRSLISRNRQTANGGASRGGGGMVIYWITFVTIRESTFDQNHAEASNNGHQIHASKWIAQSLGAPAVTVVNTRFIPCITCETSGPTSTTSTEFFLYDYDDGFNNGAAKYGAYSRKTWCMCRPNGRCQ